VSREAHCAFPNAHSRWRGFSPNYWVDARLDAIDADEMRELVEDAWAFCVPKGVAEEYAAARGYRAA
jgi:hypothetical protein